MSSISEIKSWSKNELKTRLTKMGMSFDKTEHPKSYFLNLYLEKFNAKNGITRSKNSFSRDMLKTKRERANSREKKEDHEYIPSKEENNEFNEGSDENILLEESEKKEKNKNSKELKKSYTQIIEENNKHYKESGIKYTRLIKKNNHGDIMERGKKLFVNNQISNQENSTDKKNAINNKNKEKNNVELSDKNKELIVEKYEKNIKEEIPLKQGRKNSEIKDIENNEFSKDIKVISIIPQTRKQKDEKNEDVDINIKSSEPIQKTPTNSNISKITFGAPKILDENNQIHLTKGPISFGFHQSKDSQNYKGTPSENDKNISKTMVNKSKMYDNFVKNVSNAVKENIKESTDKKSKPIYLKFDTPRQKEFLKNSMDEYPINNNNDNDIINSENKINVSYDFNERLNNCDDDNNIKLLRQKKEINLFNNSNNNYNKNQVENAGLMQNKNIIKESEQKNFDSDNDYKHKLRSYEKNAYKKNEEDIFNNDEVKNSFKEENNYIDSQDINKNDIIEQKKYNVMKKESYQNNYKNYKKDNAIKENNAMHVEEEEPKLNNEYYNDYSIQRNTDNLYVNDKNINNNLYYQNYQYNNNEDIYNTNNNNILLEDKIKYNERNEQNIPYNENDMYERNIGLNNINNSSEISTESRRSKFLRKISGVKNTIMNKFKNNVYIWPLLLLIVFGITYLLNNSFERFDNINIIIVFSIFMALLIIYNLIKCIKTKINYKKMAKDDKKALLELLNDLNIDRETLGNNIMLINNFIISRINEQHKITKDEYMKYVFPYLKKYLAKEGFVLNQEDENDETKHEFWKEI